MTYYETEADAQASLDEESAFTANGAEGKVGLAVYFVLGPELAPTVEGCL
ncbi:MAG: hypothetical protein WKF93_00795 [Acidimicrobiales bacterium]